MTDDKKLEALSHEWTNSLYSPSSLFEPNSELELGYGMRKGNKSEFVTGLSQYLGSKWSEKDNLGMLNNTAYIVDAMAFIQKYQRFGCTTFKDLQEYYLSKLFSNAPENCQVIHFVGDRYDFGCNVSLKQEERAKREGLSKMYTKTYEPHDNIEVPEWKEFIRKDKNKSSLLQYIEESWLKSYERVPENTMLITGGLSNDPANSQNT